MKRALARFFFAAGRAYIHARRVLDGVSLEFRAHRAPPCPASWPPPSPPLCCTPPLPVRRPRAKTLAETLTLCMPSG